MQTAKLRFERRRNFVPGSQTAGRLAEARAVAFDLLNSTRNDSDANLIKLLNEVEAGSNTYYSNGLVRTDQSNQTEAHACGLDDIPDFVTVFREKLEVTREMLRIRQQSRLLHLADEASAQIFVKTNDLKRANAKKLDAMRHQCEVQLDSALKSLENEHDNYRTAICTDLEHTHALKMRGLNAQIEAVAKTILEQEEDLEFLRYALAKKASLIKTSQHSHEYHGPAKGITARNGGAIVNYYIYVLSHQVQQIASWKKKIYDEEDGMNAAVARREQNVKDRSLQTVLGPTIKKRPHISTIPSCETLKTQAKLNLKWPIFVSLNISGVKTAVKNFFAKRFQFTMDQSQLNATSRASSPDEKAPRYDLLASLSDKAHKLSVKLPAVVSLSRGLSRAQSRGASLFLSQSLSIASGSLTKLANVPGEDDAPSKSLEEIHSEQRQLLAEESASFASQIKNLRRDTEKIVEKWTVRLEAVRNVKQKSVLEQVLGKQAALLKIARSGLEGLAPKLSNKSITCNLAGVTLQTILRRIEEAKKPSCSLLAESLFDELPQQTAVQSVQAGSFSAEAFGPNQGAVSNESCDVPYSLPVEANASLSIQNLALPKEIQHPRYTSSLNASLNRGFAPQSQKRFTEPAIHFREAEKKSAAISRATVPPLEDEHVDSHGATSNPRDDQNTPAPDPSMTSAVMSANTPLAAFSAIAPTPGQVRRNLSQRKLKQPQHLGRVKFGVVKPARSRAEFERQCGALVTDVQTLSHALMALSEPLKRQFQSEDKRSIAVKNCHQRSTLALPNAHYPSEQNVYVNTLAKAIVDPPQNLILKSKAAPSVPKSVRSPTPIKSSSSG